jgi:hypothetical protein
MAVPPCASADAMEVSPCDKSGIGQITERSVYSFIGAMQGIHVDSQAGGGEIVS